MTRAETPSPSVFTAGHGYAPTSAQTPLPHAVTEDNGGCRGCGTAEGPFTATRFCPECASNACAEGDGDRVGLPVPTDLDAAVAQLANHRDPVHGWWHRVSAGCLVCLLATRKCGECGLMLGDMSDSQVDEHRLCANELFLAVGCEGYVTPAVRAAALEVHNVKATRALKLTAFGRAVLDAAPKEQGE